MLIEFKSIVTRDLVVNSNLASVRHTGQDVILALGDCLELDLLQLRFC